MTDTDQSDGLDWRDGNVPASTLYGDPYFSLQGGLDEARHVFLAGNGLPDRFAAGFHIAELGFGTGLNMLAALTLWRAAGIPGPLRYTAFEAHPLPASAITCALATFPELATVAEPFLDRWAAGETRFALPGLEAEVIIGDATATLPTWEGRADAWFLDGFAPAKNPAMWGDALMGQVGTHTALGGTFATYTAAGHVRRALQAAGFAVDRRAGFGRKRHMTIGVLPE